MKILTKLTFFLFLYTSFLFSGTSENYKNFPEEISTTGGKVYSENSNIFGVVGETVVGKNENSNYKSSSGFLSSQQTPPEVTLEEALDTSEITWITGGDAEWFGQTSVFYYGNDAAQSGLITDNQTSWLTTTVEGPGTLDFYWKVSSEENFDFLIFYIDNVEQDRISGETDWIDKSYEISSGQHELKWVYSKNESINSGSDCGWVDYVTFNQSTPPSPPSSGGGGGGGCFIATAAYGSPLSKQVIILKKFRDKYLLTNIPSRAFVRFYYNHSPKAADFIRNHVFLKILVRILLYPIILISYLMIHPSLVYLSLLFSFLTFIIFLLRRKKCVS